MSDLPPPLIHSGKKTRHLWVIVDVVLVLGLGAFFAIRGIVASGITRGPDAMFGDQHLKTAVALIELHKVRTGKYPGDLSELQFTGQWDMIALAAANGVRHLNVNFPSPSGEVNTDGA